MKVKPEDLAALRRFQQQTLAVPPVNTRTPEDVMREEKERAKREEKEQRG